MANIVAYSDYSLSHELRTRLFPFTFHDQKSSLASKPSTSWPRPILSATVNPYGVFIWHLQNPPLLHHLAQCFSPHNCVWSGDDGVDNKNSHAIGLRDGASDAKSTPQISTHVRISNFLLRCNGTNQWLVLFIARPKPDSCGVSFVPDGVQ